ncbi:MAG: hypothetical protein K9J30_02305 [Bacteroidales bacterium]|nr:hypothetical protein [Bacteroidales bacterium]
MTHEYLYWRTDFNKAVRSANWKLLWNTRDGKTYLYDMRLNNYERRNEAPDHPDVIRDLQEKYMKWEKYMKAPFWPGVMEFKFDIDGEVSWWTI